MKAVNLNSVLHILHRYGAFMFVSDGKKYAEMLDEIVSLSDMTQKWTPVSEGMPKVGEYVNHVEQYYLVQNEYGDMLVASYHGKYWEQMYQTKPIEDKIVAWMPLPKPYEGE